MDRSINNPKDGGAISSLVYDIKSGGNKAVLVAPALIHLNFSEDYVAAGRYQTLYVFNSSPSVQWLYMSKTKDVPVPALDFSNAFPLTPMAWNMINTQEKNLIAKPDASVGVYLMKDDTTVR